MSMNDKNHAEVEPMEDPLYPLLLTLLPGMGRFRVASVQRSLSIGYNRATRLIERLEKDGHIKVVPDEQGGHFVTTARAD